MLEADGEGEGRWLLDGEPAPHLEGCRDVDLESSAMTNSLPLHRMELPVLRLRLPPGLRRVGPGAGLPRDRDPGGVTVST